MDREENLLIAKNLLRVIEKLQRAGRRGDIVGVIANELDTKDRKAAQQSVKRTGSTCPRCGVDRATEIHKDGCPLAIANR